MLDLRLQVAFEGVAGAQASAITRAFFFLAIANTPAHGKLQSREVSYKTQNDVWHRPVFMRACGKRGGGPATTFMRGVETELSSPAELFYGLRYIEPLYE